MSSPLLVIAPMAQHDKHNPTNESPTSELCEPPPMMELGVYSRRH
jgi:hypothetical protein